MMPWFRSQDPKNDNPSCPDCCGTKWGVPKLLNCERKGHLYCQVCGRYFEKSNLNKQQSAIIAKGSGKPKHAPRGVSHPPQKITLNDLRRKYSAIYKIANCKGNYAAERVAARRMLMKFKEKYFGNIDLRKTKITDDEALELLKECESLLVLISMPEFVFNINDCV